MLKGSVIAIFSPKIGIGGNHAVEGHDLSATGFIDDLIPHIDTTYRTIAAQHGRAIQGFSMGGFGALIHGFRSSEQFSAVLVWDGAIHNWETLSTNRSSIANKMFATEGYFDLWSPWTLTAQGPNPELDLFIIVGDMNATRESAQKAYELGYPVALLEADPDISAAGASF